MSLPDLPTSGSANFESNIRQVLNQWKADIEAKAASGHSHGAGGEVISVVAGQANLGTGSTDGERKITADEYGNQYTWDDDNSKWRPHSGNIYTTADLPTTAMTIPTGTIVEDITLHKQKRWNGSSWELLSIGENLTNYLMPSTYDDLIRTGYKPFFSNQQYGGAPIIGESLIGTGEDYCAGTGYIVNNANSFIGKAAGNTWRAMAFKVSESTTFSATEGAIALKMHKIGNPQIDTENFLVQIASSLDNGSGITLVHANAVATKMNGCTITPATSGNWPMTGNDDGEICIFDGWGGEFTLSPNTTYYAAIQWNEAAADASNHFKFHYDGDGSYPHGNDWGGDDATPTTWSENAGDNWWFQIIAPAANSLIQTGGQFQNLLEFSEGSPLNQSKILIKPLRHFWTKDGEFTQHFTVEDMTASKAFWEAWMGQMSNNRIRVYTDAQANLCIDVREDDGTSHTITDGTTDLSSGKINIEWSVRAKGDGSDFVKLKVEGSDEGTQLSNLSITFDDNFGVDLGYEILGGGFPAPPTFDEDEDMSALPSAGNWTYNGTATEANGFSAQNGILYQNKNGFGSGEYGQYYFNDAGISNANGWYAEVKFKIKECVNTSGELAAQLNFDDGTDQPKIVLHEYYIETVNWGTNFKYQVDLTDKHHVISVDAKGDDIFVYLDGKPILDGTGLMTDAGGSLKRFYFGDADNTAGSVADVEWAYYKLYYTSNLPVEANDCKVHELAYWTKDMTHLASQLYNSGTLISVKDLCGIRDNIVQEVLPKYHSIGIGDSSAVGAWVIPHEAFILTPKGKLGCEFQGFSTDAIANNSAQLEFRLNGEDKDDNFCRNQIPNNNGWAPLSLLHDYNVLCGLQKVAVHGYLDNGSIDHSSNMALEFKDK